MNRKYFFIDESGDPMFYAGRKKLLVGTEGFQPYLIIGMIETENRRLLRKAVVEFMDDIKKDKLYNTIPSIAANKGWYIHARGDHPEIRVKFFEMLRKLDGYQADIVIAKKDLRIFNRKHNNSPTEFYFDVLYHLIDKKLSDPGCEYMLYLSQRGNNSLDNFQKAVDRALMTNDTLANPINCKLEVVPGAEMPELSIIDYLIWAVQRKLLRDEARYFEALEDKYRVVLNLYDTI